MTFDMIERFLLDSASGFFCMYDTLNIIFTLTALRYLDLLKMFYKICLSVQN